METIKEEQKILVKYLYEKPIYDTKLVKNEMGVYSAELEKTKGEFKGCLIALGKGIIGWSLINKKDRAWNYRNEKYWDWADLGSKEKSNFMKRSKDISYTIAMNRALLAETSEDLEKFYSKVPNSLSEEFNKMLERADKYFQ